MVSSLGVGVLALSRYCRRTWQACVGLGSGFWMVRNCVKPWPTLPSAKYHCRLVGPIPLGGGGGGVGVLVVVAVGPGVLVFVGVGVLVLVGDGQGSWINHCAGESLSQFVVKFFSNPYIIIAIHRKTIMWMCITRDALIDDIHI